VRYAGGVVISVVLTANGAAACFVLRVLGVGFDWRLPGAG
jgi:hypothetical protein